ncbi:hypothetical protein SAMN05421780_10864 [Flexibacter flexilis DSM 6793]|uniref:Sensory transduction regulator n=1 Tax=Flexibacter flexilis DSM 6793 TaxID=927664 RepID=A0A1I1L522_9BACT|nr:hypothetical protein [Flexibacter flexilis]SFC68081.1 hypothetical protein SAMN05421780_10864 [Flexibacter flexilis DSM 6793]
MMTGIKKYLLVCAIGFISLPTFAQMGGADYDNRVKAKLDEWGVKYEISEKGNFKLVFDMGENRTQLVIINSNTYDYNNIEVREIYSTAAKGNKSGDFAHSDLFTLLRDNADKKIGAWQIDGTEGTYRLNFSLRASAVSGLENLKSMVQLAAKVADAKEKLLSKGDEF